MAENLDFGRTGPGGAVEGGILARRNLLLTLTPQNELGRIEPHLEQVDFALRDNIYENNQPNTYSYFPYGGVFSMVSLPGEDDGLIVEVATVGNEGMIGLPLLLGGENTPGRCFCQVPGQTVRIAAEPFRDLVDTCSGFRRILLRYAQALITLIAQGAACNRMHPVEERCARWLLMTQDRVGADHFMLTQDFLAQMLGVRRPSVSVAASLLQKAELIRYSRGLMVITDRAGLEAAACNCYRVIREEFNRLLK